MPHRAMKIVTNLNAKTGEAGLVPNPEEIEDWTELKDLGTALGLKPEVLRWLEDLDESTAFASAKQRILDTYNAGKRRRDAVQMVWRREHGEPVVDVYGLDDGSEEGEELISIVLGTSSWDDLVPPAAPG